MSEEKKCEEKKSLVVMNTNGGLSACLKEDPGSMILCALIQKIELKYHDKLETYQSFFIDEKTKCDSKALTIIPPKEPLQLDEDWKKTVTTFLHRTDQVRGKEAKADIVIELFCFLRSIRHLWLHIGRFATTVFRKMVEFQEEPLLAEFVTEFAPLLFDKDYVMEKLRCHYCKKIEYIKTNFTYIGVKKCVDNRHELHKTMEKLSDMDNLEERIQNKEAVEMMELYGMKHVVIDTKINLMHEVEPKITRNDNHCADVEMLTRIKLGEDYSGTSLGFKLTLQSKTGFHASGVAYVYLKYRSRRMEDLCVGATGIVMEGTTAVFEFPTIMPQCFGIYVKMVWYNVPWKFLYTNRFMAKGERDVYNVSSYDLEQVIDGLGPFVRRYRHLLWDHYDSDDSDGDSDGDSDADDEVYIYLGN
jgi:hypothetical protein